MSINKKPIISIIVPVYNCERYLGKCLETVIGQTMKNIEIVAVDNGSTDKSGDILKSYAESDKRITIITQENMGVYGSRNTGLKNSNGEYVTFVDADDYVEPYFCETLYKEIRNTGSDVAICDYNMDYASKIVSSILDLPTSTTQTEELEPHIVFLRFFARNPVVWNKLYKRSIIDENNIEFEVAHGEDLLFHLRLLPHIKKICTVATAPYHYLQRKNSLAHSLKEINRDSIHILNRYLDTSDGTHDDILAYCAFASIFTGFAFSSYCIGRGVSFYYKQLKQFQLADFFPGFCKAITKTGSLEVLYKEKTITKRFYHIMRSLFRCCVSKRYRFAAVYWWAIEQAIILKKRAFLFDQIR